MPTIDRPVTIIAILSRMPAPPVNIFTQNFIPEDALTRLVELIPEGGDVVHTAGQWSQITGKWKRGWLQSPLTLRVTHSPEYYAGDDWPNQLRGMANYVGKFPGSEKRTELSEYIMGLSFALSFVAESDLVDNDPRLDVVFEMARFLDGVVFLPTCLLDAFSRVIVSADGQLDPDAKLPEHTPKLIETPVAREYSEDLVEVVAPPTA